MGLRQTAADLEKKIVDTVEKNESKIVKYGKYSAIIVILLVILYFLYKKFGDKLLNRPKRYF